MAPEPTTLALLYEEELLREALAGTLSKLPGYHLLLHVGDVSALKRAAAVGQRPMVYLLGQAAAMADQCALLHWCTRHLPGTHLVLLGQQPEPDDLLPTIGAGASAFVCTRDGEAALLHVLDHVVGGWLYLPPLTKQQLRETLCQTTYTPSSHAPPEITQRQHELLRWKADGAGYTNKQIAEHMHISESAVEKLVQNICRNHKLKGHAALAQFALRYA